MPCSAGQSSSPYDQTPLHRRSPVRILKSPNNSIKSIMSSSISMAEKSADADSAVQDQTLTNQTQTDLRTDTDFDENAPETTAPDLLVQESAQDSLHNDGSIAENCVKIAKDEAPKSGIGDKSGVEDIEKSLEKIAIENDEKNCDFGKDVEKTVDSVTDIEGKPDRSSDEIEKSDFVKDVEKSDIEKVDFSGQEIQECEGIEKFDYEKKNSEFDVPDDDQEELSVERPSSSKLNAGAPAFVPRSPVFSVAAPGIAQAVDVCVEQHEEHVKDASASKPVLTDDLRHKIVKQVEFYFSDANLRLDKHLLKYIKKDPEGFVPISSIASFKKLKSLIGNNTPWVSLSLKTSTHLVVSEDGRRVRRLHPFSDIDKEEVQRIQSRTVLAENLPDDHSIENLEKIFSAVGNVILVRVSDGVAHATGKNHMLVSNRLHALVEYESVEQAEKAVLELNDGQNWRSGLRVQMLLKRMGKYNNQPKTRVVDTAEAHIEDDDTANVQDTGNGKHPKGSQQQVDKSDEHEGEGSNMNDKNGGKRGRGRGKGKIQGQVQGHGHGHGHGHGLGRGQNVGNNGRGQNGGNNGRGTNGGARGRGHASVSVNETTVKPPPGPKMPDGTRGFTMGRGKPLSSNIRA